MNEATNKTVLNAGSGPANAGRLHPAFSAASWREVRFDIDPTALPDLVGSITNMRGVVADRAFDAVWSSHSVEHLHAHEVLPAFREFRRILKNDGFAIVTCPDLGAIARLLASDDIESISFQSPAGPIRPLDMIFGHGRSIEAGHLSMAHKTGFTVERLGRISIEAGFVEARIMEGGSYDLWALLLAPEARPAQIAPIFQGTNITKLFDDSGEGYRGIARIGGTN